MDSSEAIAKGLLMAMGFSNVEYEPDGNVPPDFLVDGHIAVEVRRLNQNHDSGSGIQGLEETEIPLWQRIENLGHSFGAATNESWFLYFRFSRPVRPWKELGPNLCEALKNFRNKPIRNGGKIYSEENFELEVIRALGPLEYYFCMGGCCDYQSGGFVVAEMLKNIECCASEKAKKIAGVKKNYPEWWLVLIDHIGFGLSGYDKEQLLMYANRPSAWDRIIVVNPMNSSDWLAF